MKDELKMFFGALIGALALMLWGGTVTILWMGITYILNQISPTNDFTMFTYNEMITFWFGIDVGILAFFMTAKLFGKTITVVDSQSCSESVTEASPSSSRKTTPGDND